LFAVHRAVSSERYIRFSESEKFQMPLSFTATCLVENEAATTS
jgi:hypothetical protein